MDNLRLTSRRVNFFGNGIGDGGRKILLRQQPLDVLRMLIEADGEIVTRQEMKKSFGQMTQL